MEENKLSGAELDAKKNEFNLKAIIDSHKTTVTNKKWEKKELKAKAVHLQGRICACVKRANKFDQIARIKVKGDVQLHKKRSENQIR